MEVSSFDITKLYVSTKAYIAHNSFTYDTKKSNIILVFTI